MERRYSVGFMTAQDVATRVIVGPAHSERPNPVAVAVQPVRWPASKVFAASVNAIKCGAVGDIPVSESVVQATAPPVT